MAVSGSAAIDATQSPRRSDDENGDRTYTVAYTVFVTDPLDLPVTVSTASGLPTVGAAFAVGNDVDVGAICRTRSFEKLDAVAKGPLIPWRVTCTWTSKKADQLGTGTPNPLNDPITWTIGFEPETVPFLKDAVATDPEVFVRNSAGDQFTDPPATTEKDILILTCEKNVASVSLSSITSLQNTINSTEFLGQAARTVKIRIRATGPHTESDVTYAKVYYDFAIKDPDWKARFLDQGLYKADKDGSTLSKSRITDANGVPVDTPQNLDGNGQPTGTDQAAILEFNEYMERSFLSLGISISSLIGLTS